MTGYARFAVADDAVADFRPHAIAGDQRAAIDAFAVFQLNRNVAAVILVSIDPPAGFQRDQIVRLAGFEKRAVNIGAMSDRVRLAEAFGEAVIERHASNQFTGEGVAHFLCRRAVGVGQDGVLEADFLQYPENIGSELDAGADLSEFRRLLEYPYGNSLARQRIGGHQATNAAAGYQERSCTTVRSPIFVGHRPSL